MDAITTQINRAKTLGRAELSWDLRKLIFRMAKDGHDPAAIIVSILDATGGEVLTLFKEKRDAASE